VSYVFYIGDYGPVSAEVFEEDGVTPVTPLSASATIVNQHTDVALVTDGAAQVSEGLMTYSIPEGSPVTAATGRYVAYLSAVIDATTKRTVEIPIEVLDKSSHLAVDRWRRKVEFSAPNEEALSDAEGRDWIDQAVAHLNRYYYDTGYTSMLATITPNTGIDAAGSNEVEFFASVASLMARTAWWAGKGNWRDEEMSLDTGPFAREWQMLRDTLSGGEDAGWYDLGASPIDQWSMYNRDKVDVFGIADKPDTYYEKTWAGE
jgi:hypothetical protein